MKLNVMLNALLSSCVVLAADSPMLSYPAKLKTKVTRGALAYDNLYLTSYHTFAGQSDVTLTRDLAVASSWTIVDNDGKLQRPLPGVKWGVVMLPAVGYVDWQLVQLRAGASGTPGFGLDAGANLTWNSFGKKGNETENEFTAWLGMNYPCNVLASTSDALW